MKKSIRLSFAIVALVSIIASCGNLIEIPEKVENQEGNDPIEQPSDGNVTFNATSETLADWLKGDKISVFDGSSVTVLENTAENGPVAKFNMESKDVSSWIAFYPPVNNMTSTSVEAELPGTQTAVMGSCQRSAAAMVAKSSTSRLYFRNLTAEISFTLDMDDVVSVTLTSVNGAPLSGTYSVNYSSDEPIVEASETASNQVQIEGNILRGEKYCFSVIPSRVEGYRLVAKNSNGEEIAHNASDDILEIMSGDRVDIGCIKADADLPQTFRITHMWLWGGTGAEYNCSKLWDMFSKPGCFDSEDGRGIEALKDDVLELHNDGTFKNWAGEDARHWWMAFDKSQTPSKYKSLDMSQYYSVLPKNEGSYTLDGQTITFTHENGSVTTGTIVGPGTYELPGCSPAKSVTITTMAIKFVITGTPDDWEHMWDDYGVFYRKPRQLYIELEQMPAGYVTPEGVKTTDKVEFVEPDDPAPDFDITTLPGSYKVKDLKLNGGSGDDPAFVGPIDKSWCWDDSIWWESDNQLDVTTSTFNYWAGEDDKFWNYKWHGGKSDEVDMSHVYGILPHGISNFTIDVETMDVTINGTIKAKLLVPGTHHFPDGNRDLTIDNGCIALHFHIMEQIDATSQRWTDVDRFVNAPIDWVMIFEKL